MNDFAGKRIVVTGAASGIGAALSGLLTERGARVIGLDIQAQDGVDVQVDLSNPESIDESATTIQGSLHGLANVAGLPGTHSPEAIIAVNLLGVRRLTERLVNKFAVGATVVCVSSIGADRCGWTELELKQFLSLPWRAAEAHVSDASLSGADTYDLSKRALNQWMLSACRDLSGKGIRINCVSPGPVETPILADFRTSMGEERVEAAARLIGRHATPLEIAEVVAFLLSDRARWVNGTILKADGGLHGLRAAAPLEKPGGS